jgi:AcrR family transcriptional regulator
MLAVRPREALGFAMETRVDDLLPRLDTAAPWRERVRRALYALHRFLAADERAAGLLLAELAGAAAEAEPVAERWTESLFDLIDEGREEPTAPDLGRMTAEALGGGICTRLYAAVVRDGRLPPEAEIVPELMYCVVLPYCGRDAAREELAISPPPAGEVTDSPGHRHQLSPTSDVG